MTLACRGVYCGALLAGMALTVTSVEEARGAVAARILSATPSVFDMGVTRDIVITAVNEGDGANFVLRWDAIPQGWSVIPRSYSGFVPPGTTVQVPFAASPPTDPGAGTIPGNSTMTGCYSATRCWTRSTRM